MAQEREARELTINEICKIHGISKSHYYNMLRQAEEAGLGDEIPVYTGKYARKSKIKQATSSNSNDSSIVSVSKYIVKITRGDTVITMPSDTSQEIITKFVKALKAC